MWQKSRTIAHFPALDKVFLRGIRRKYDGGGEYKEWECLVRNNKINLVQARCHWVHLHSQQTLKKHQLTMNNQKCVFPLWLWQPISQIKCINLLSFKKRPRESCVDYIQNKHLLQIHIIITQNAYLIIYGIIDYLILKFHVKCYNVLEPDTLLDKKHNKMSKSFKGPTEVSFSLHKQCEIQRDSARYTKGLAVKHLGFLTGVMLGEQTWRTKGWQKWVQRDLEQWVICCRAKAR